MQPSMIETDVLIVGSGPAGASLASFLAFNGVKGLMINHRPSTVTTPRAHFMSLAGMETLRDIGLEEEAVKHGTLEADMGPWYRFSNTLTGGEFFRRFAFGNDPKRQGDCYEASPCRYLDLPQTQSEPLLVKYATQHGFHCRNDVELVSFQDDTPSPGFVTTTLRDLLTGQAFQVKSRFLCGADGARSRVLEQLGIPVHNDGMAGEHMAMNVLYECDQSHIMKGGNQKLGGIPDSSGLLTGLLAWDKPSKEWSIGAVHRCIKPYKEWLIVFLSAPHVKEINVTDGEVLERIKDYVGDTRMPIKLIKRSIWVVNESHASQLSKGNVFCLGDAIHRHSPGKGLGANTCFQDAYNLAWKLAFVLRGSAPRSLLSSYNAERLPVAKLLPSQANSTVRHHFALWAALGVLNPTPETRGAALAALAEPNAESKQRRKAIREAIEALESERCALGCEMNIQYTDPDCAVYVADEIAPKPQFDKDPERYYHESTYPGFRLPHAWLGTDIMGQLVSTQDLAGKGRFTLFTGIGGKEVWSQACKLVAVQLNGVEIECVSIGWGQDYSDALGMWERKMEVEEDGCVLVRPDRYVAWRCGSLEALGEGTGKAGGKLVKVLKHVLKIEIVEEGKGMTNGVNMVLA